MTPLPPQQTRFERASSALAAMVLSQLRGGWRHRSAQLLALLLGFYAGGNVTAYVLPMFPGGRPAMVVAVVVALELLVRLRSRMVGPEPPLGWRLLDNLRIGVVYAVVLEAFKLGT